MASTASISTVLAEGKEPKPKPKVSTLQTPVSASYPSEIRSPLPGAPAYLIKEDNIRTPITPPHAYLDFLKTMSPVLMSPAPTGTSSHFSFPSKAAMREVNEVEGKISSSNSAHPSLSRTSSSDSATVVTLSSGESDTGDASDASVESLDSKDTIKREVSEESSSFRHKKAVQALDLSKSKEHSAGSKPKPQSPRIVIPPSSSFAKPGSAKWNLRSQMPGSPLSPANTRTPLSARSHHEPRSASCLSATPWSASSPNEADVSSKHNPAPKGKRRKLEE
ncbi:hypothetical protein AAFC00_003720 [Neodothiora populina]|uniref:Uncharacterized protein n=1 Tax=Neodothiora populina TaxID=2781224 RepID=A0ABR3PF65_9PEZI